MARKLTDTVQLKLRFDEKLRRRLEREAAQNARSMNAEIIQRLEQSFHQLDQKEFIKTVTQASATAAEAWRITNSREFYSRGAGRSSRTGKTCRR
jgi:hypothetical protein